MRHSRKYNEYLKSETWRKRRLAKLESASFRCEKCGEKRGLTVHHKTYKNLGNEDTRDLIVLCKSCHWVADETRIGNDKIEDKFYAKFGGRLVNRKERIWVNYKKKLTKREKEKQKEILRDPDRIRIKGRRPDEPRHKRATRR